MIFRRSLFIKINYILIFLSTILTTLILNSFYKYFYVKHGAIFERSTLTRKSNQSICTNTSSNWIVLTTIFYPTFAVKRLLLLDDWMLVIIADRKTPLDWISHVPFKQRQKLIYLSLSDQKRLDYSIVQYIPENSYARKTIGYLVAIQCGAKVIFETDDDNVLKDLFIKVLPKLSSPIDISKAAFHGKRSSFVNIYGSFGEPNIWPRGFPLQQFKNVTEDGWSSLRRNDEPISAYIQQFLADLDPDVDAIYRLTNSFRLGHIQFDPQQTPIALDAFTFSPYNTQNTITHYEAFWGLILPITTTSRVCDIWRGFWVQRLLWDIGGRLVFAGPTVEQKRNVHSYLKDMKDEQQMYYEAAAFVHFLASWKSSSTSVFEKIRALANDIAQQGFWQMSEVNYIDIWLQDLLRVGYQPPPFRLSPKDNRKPKRHRRAAVCVTGKLSLRRDTWIKVENQLRIRFRGEIDTFYYLSSSMPIKSSELDNETFARNATVEILNARRYLDYRHSNVSCQRNLSSSDDVLENYLYDVWAQAECYNLVVSYQKQNNVKYDLIVHVKYNSIFVKMPTSYERKSPFDANKTIILSLDIHHSKVSNQFVIGPAKKMSYYMRRWYILDACLLQSMDLEKQLASISQINKVMILDNETITDVHLMTKGHITLE
ncbi:unnamed protein product [Adineta ricciae]|uniref:Uncharacterized protein n=1 Tax=Adineta ricciae TaxID=249248 RepID=A0A815PBB0_ADIRI|nr:unnamed protein product [Adineta ricciae]